MASGFRLRSEIPLMLAALFVAFIIWVMAKQTSQETEQVPVRVSLQEMPNVTLSPLPQTIPVLVKFPPSQRARVSPGNFDIRVDVAKAYGADPRAWAWDGRGEAVVLPPIDLTLDNVHSVDLPQSIHVMDIGPPSRVQIEARLRTRSLPIKVETSGKLPSDYELSGVIRVDPPEILVTGSKADLDRLADPAVGSAVVGPIKLDERKQDFTESIEVAIPAGVQVVEDSRKIVQVYANVREKSKQETIEAVPIQLFTLAQGLKTKVTPATARVRVKGRISLVDQVEPRMFAFAPKVFLAEEPGVNKEVELQVSFTESAPSAIREGVEIEALLSPTTVTIEYSKK